MDSTVELSDIGRSTSVALPAWALATVLTTALTLVTPLLRLLVGVPLLYTTVAFGVSYFLLILLTGNLERGSFVGFVVTSTFGANVPLYGGGMLYQSDMGPEVMLATGPLALIVALSLLHDSWSLPSLSTTTLLLSGFVLWSLVTGMFSRHPDAAVFFSLFYLQGLLAYTSILKRFKSGSLEIETIVDSLIIVVVGHALVATTQFFQQGTMKMTYLGESQFVTNSAILLFSRPMIIGPYISGFARWEFGFHIILVTPLLLVYTVRTESRVRQAAGWCILAGLLFLLGLTNIDSTRGGSIIAVLSFGGMYVWKTRSVPSVFGSKSIVGSKLDSLETTMTAVLLFFISSIPVVPTKLIAGVSRHRATSESPQKLSDTSNGGNGTSPSATPTGTSPSATPTGTSPSTTPSVGQGETPGQISGSPSKSDDSSLVVDWVVSILNSPSFVSRIEQYRSGLSELAASPIIGIGGANYVLVSGIDKRIHSLYLQILVQTGIIGFLLYASAVMLPIVHGVRSVIESSDEWLWQLAILCGLLGFFAGLFFGPGDKYTLLFPQWTLLATLSGIRSLE